MNSPIMKFHGRMQATNGIVLNGGIPENPHLNMLWVIEGVPCVYTVLEGITGWYPIIRGMETVTYRHVQAVAATEWVVQHNLGTQDYWFIIKDGDNNIVPFFVEMVHDPIDPLNKTKFTFSEPISGNIFIVSSKSFSTPQLNTSEIILGPQLKLDTSGIQWKGVYLNLDQIAAQTESIKSLQAQISAEVTRATGKDSAHDSAIATLQAQVAAIPANSQRYDLSFSSPGNLVVDQRLFDSVAVVNYTIPVTGPGVYAMCDVGPAATVVLDVMVGTTTIATFTFAPGSTTAAFADVSANRSVTKGQRVKVVSKTADATIKNIAITIPALLA